MLFIIIAVVIVIFSIGALKSMTPTERSIVVRRTLNILTFGIVYLFRAGKEGVKISYQAGRVAGATLSLHGQDTLAAMADHNNSVAEKGGAVKEAIRVSKSHGEALGLSNVAASLKAEADELDVLLAQARAYTARKAEASTK